MPKTIKQINQHILKQAESFIKEYAKMYGTEVDWDEKTQQDIVCYDTSPFKTADGGYEKDHYKDSIANDYAEFYEIVAKNIDQPQDLWQDKLHYAVYCFMNGYENNCDVESWIQDKADREFYISQAKILDFEETA